MAERAFLIQCLCENRHAILGATFVAEDQDAEEVKRAGKRAQQSIENLFTSGAFNRWCGICGGTELKFEVDKVAVTNPEDAFTALKECEKSQLETRAILDAQGLTYDSAMKN